MYQSINTNVNEKEKGVMIAIRPPRFPSSGISMVFKGEWFMSFVHVDGIDYIDPSVSLRWVVLVVVVVIAVIALVLLLLLLLWSAVVFSKGRISCRTEMHISIHANRNLTIAGYVLCAFGGVLFIFMLLGLFGSSYSNQCLLGSYVTCLVVILLVKVSHSNSRIFIPWLACVVSYDSNDDSASWTDNGADVNCQNENHEAISDGKKSNQWHEDDNRTTITAIYLGYFVIVTDDYVVFPFVHYWIVKIECFSISDRDVDLHLLGVETISELSRRKLANVDDRWTRTQYQESQGDTGEGFGVLK